MRIEPRTRREQGSLRRLRRLTMAVVVAFVAVTFAAPSAEAGWPGQNGRIAFDRFDEAGGQIFTISGIGNGSGVQLTTEGVNEAPSFSPNGAEIAFDSDRTGVFQLFLMGAGGGDQREISPNGNCAVYPSWSPNGKRVVYTQFPDATCDGAPDVWSVRRDGTNARQLTNTPAERELSPVYSPDGSKIAFTSHDGTPSSFAVFTINADGTGRRRITPRSLLASNPDWSPDGQKIAVASGESEPQSSLFTIDPDGTNLRRLTPNVPDVKNTLPRWSPDGKQILFVSNYEGQFDLFSYRVSNGKVRRRGLRTPDSGEFGASWQPKV